MLYILQQLAKTLEDHKSCVLCTVVETRGSTPQKAGATMLVHADGSQAGTLGGGCVEAEVRQRSLRVLNDPAAGAEVFSFSLDDNYGWDDGLICGGRMVILADPLREDARSYFETYQNLVAGGCTEAVVMMDSTGDLAAGSRYLLDATGSLLAQRAMQPPSQAVVDSLRPLTQRPRPYAHRGIAYLPVLPRIRLLIVGGGHVGQAVAELAARVEFDIWVLDDREKYANAERFPAAERCLVGDIGKSLKSLVSGGEITPNTYCLIVTRGHNHDEEALYHLAATPAGYVGMIGSKRKIKLIYEDLIAKNIPESTLEKVHAPLGLPIGSQTVPEIAVSIVAELIAHRNLGKTNR
jgi:xanthine dehydrogenase accessory factor